MNNHKLKKLMSSPKREAFLMHLKEDSCFWNYKDKKCRYHREETGQGSDHVHKHIDKFIGKPWSDFVKFIKKHTRYKYDHFFRNAVDDKLRGIANQSYSYTSFDEDYYIERGTYILRKREEEITSYSISKIRRKMPRGDMHNPQYVEYVNGVIIERRKGIYYHLFEYGHHEERWCDELGTYHAYVQPVYRQLNTFWLKEYRLSNIIEEQ